jgi:putative SOS response-associated peptidase YedK
MCYSAASHLSAKEIYQLEHDFVTKWEEEDFNDAYFAVSGFAHPRLPVITSEGKFKALRWGLIPAWVKDWENARKLRVQTLNAQGETIGSKPSFRGAVKDSRFCVVPVNGYYEWHHHANGQKYPFFIYPKQEPYFLFGGLYEQWINRELGEVHHTFTVVTTPANERMEKIHNSKKRMPLILTTEQAKLWLDRELPFNEKKKLITSYDPALMLDHSIGKLITSRKEDPNQPAVIEKVEYPELQLELG